MPITNYPRSVGLYTDNDENHPPTLESDYGRDRNVVAFSPTLSNVSITNHVWQVVISGFAAAESFTLNGFSPTASTIESTVPITFEAFTGSESTAGSLRYALAQSNIMGTGNYSTNLATSGTLSSVTFTITNTGTRAGKFYRNLTSTAPATTVTPTSLTNGGVMTASWTVPQHVTRLKEVFLAGGGGGGGLALYQATGSAAGSGGGGGGGLYAENVTVTPGETLSITVGHGGIGSYGHNSVTSGKDGQAGGQSIIAAGTTGWTLTANGGNLGIGAVAATTPTAAATVATGGTATNFTTTYTAFTVSTYAPNRAFFLSAGASGGAGVRTDGSPSVNTWVNSVVAAGTQGSSTTRSLHSLAFGTNAGAAGSSGDNPSISYTTRNMIQTETLTGFGTGDSFYLSLTQPDATIIGALVTFAAYTGSISTTNSLAWALNQILPPATLGTGPHFSINSISAAAFTVEFIGYYATLTAPLLQFGTAGSPNSGTGSGVTAVLTTTQTAWGVLEVRPASPSGASSSSGLFGGGGYGTGVAATASAGIVNYHDPGAGTNGGGGGGGGAIAIATATAVTATTSSTTGGKGGDAAPNSGAGGGGGGAAWASTSYTQGRGGAGGNGFVVIAY